MGQKFDNFGIWDKVSALVTVEGTVSGGKGGRNSNEMKMNCAHQKARGMGRGGRVGPKRGPSGLAKGAMFAEHCSALLWRRDEKAGQHAGQLWPGVEICPASTRVVPPCPALSRVRFFFGKKRDNQFRIANFGIRIGRAERGKSCRVQAAESVRLPQMTGHDPYHLKQLL